MHMHLPVVTLHASIFYYILVINAREQKKSLYDMTFPLVDETQPLRLIHLHWHRIEPGSIFKKRFLGQGFHSV